MGSPPDLPEIFIGSRAAGPGRRPFVVAEMSGNHNRSLETALAIVRAAADAGADALKIQTYTPDTMTLDEESDLFRVRDPRSPWHGRSLYDLYREAQTPREWHEAIRNECRAHEIEFFSTPFDPTAVDFLESLGVTAYKVSSFEVLDLALIRRIGATGKPLILSTGMATAAELSLATEAARESGVRNLILLKCTSAYPAPPECANLLTIPHMREKFRCQVGLSDHSPGIGVAVAAVALGATVIEKHLTLRRSDGGPDAAFSLEPHELKSLVTEARRAWSGLGSVHYGPTREETRSLEFRRSLYAVTDIRAGERLTPLNVRALRPGHGLSPEHLESILGKRAAEDLPRGTPLGLESVDWRTP